MVNQREEQVYATSSKEKPTPEIFPVAADIPAPVSKVSEKNKICNPLETYLSEHLFEQTLGIDIVLEGMFESSCSSLPKSRQAAIAMCKLLDDADLDFQKLHGIHNQLGTDEVELALRTAFLHKMVGQTLTLIHI